jgi:hypothetical protein
MSAAMASRSSMGPKVTSPTLALSAAISIARPLGVFCVESCSGAGDVGVHVEEVIEDAVTQGVVHHSMRGLGGRRRRSDDVDDRDEFGEAARDGVDRAQLTDPKGGAQRGDSPQPAVSVGGVACVQLVAAPGPFDRRMRDDVIEQAQAVVARDTEDPVDAQLRQAVKR